MIRFAEKIEKNTNQKYDSGNNITATYAEIPVHSGALNLARLWKSLPCEPKPWEPGTTCRSLVELIAPMVASAPLGSMHICLPWHVHTSHNHSAELKSVAHKSRNTKPCY